MRLWTSAIFWGILAGLVLGFFGIPVPVPATTWWAWSQPIGFHTASVLSLGALGFLIGLLIDLIRFRVRFKLPQAILWVNALVAFALLVSIVQIFRLAASDANGNLSVTADSVLAFYAVSRDLRTNPTEADLQSYAAQLRAAGAELYVVSQYYYTDRTPNPSMANVSSGLTTSGLLLASSNPSHVKEAEAFIEKASATFQSIEKAHSFAYNASTMQSMLNQISAEEPQQFKTNYGGA